MRNFLDDSVAEHKSKPPIRWIANWMGSIASGAMLKIAFMEEDGYTGWKYKFNGWLWDTFWPIYNKYGTFYKLDVDLSGAEWDDYDADGIPYWEKTGTIDPDYVEWDFEDEENGDAFRVL